MLRRYTAASKRREPTRVAHRAPPARFASWALQKALAKTSTESTSEKSNWVEKVLTLANPVRYWIDQTVISSNVSVNAGLAPSCPIELVSVLDRLAPGFAPIPQLTRRETLVEEQEARRALKR
ncbi:uncharacterized protein ColSpa_06499 [Colletotrichum spaethianum]|uniref:Uncharacterized protein n=1 Tax=Colletotrichum spaethianum TaxID=700344 RepID=A0AA37LDB8_9PEZI|nr:uncharacterized protein ColSpa_06499 [Colletotrichum spaethianum]GKT46318.1 hypothetical protein ColSpa_06499 [Colletotrichum spaethianum]